MGRIYKSTRAAAHNPLKPKLASRGEHFFSVAFGMLDVLNATVRVTKHPSQRILSLDQRLPSDIRTHDKMVKSQGHALQDCDSSGLVRPPESVVHAWY